MSGLLLRIRLSIYYYYCYYCYYYYYYYYFAVFSLAFSRRYFSQTSGDHHRSGFQFQTAELSVLCVMFLV